MRTLEEFNSARRTIWAMGKETPQLNGIACPTCGDELYDSDPYTTLTSNPPQKHVHCSKCQYHGLRVA